MPLVGVVPRQDVHEIRFPDVGASARGNTAPPMRPFTVMEDDRLKVTAVLVPHGPVFPSFAFRFDTDHGSVTFSGAPGPSPTWPNWHGTPACWSTRR
ncbi:hypothetical protein ACIRO1_40015 [Streptomyces sp. NPDC102381]|uniref:hypothetical protein n=1 Tax=Streptomyces sp. NPDC102381 TaxID=3366164 RepID=UPI0037F476BC